MKKNLMTFALFLTLSTVAYGQLKIYSNGNMTLDRSSQLSMAKFAIGSTAATSGQKMNIYSNLAPSANKINFGIYSRVVSPSSNGSRNFGIVGEAGGDSNACNIGLCGYLSGTEDGIAILGTTSNCFSGVTTDTRLAGFFNGPVEIYGTTDIYGTLHATLIDYGSSANSRQMNIQDREEAVADQLTGLHAVSYYKDNNNSAVIQTEGKGKIPATSLLSDLDRQQLEKKHFALSADALEEVYPDLVYKGKDGSKCINYVGMIPLLVQSIGELNEKIAQLKGENKALQAKAMKNVTGVEETVDEGRAMISQNAPNPFVDITRIEVNVPSTVKSAQLFFYDMSGKQIQQRILSERGKFSVLIEEAGFTPGMYLYSLIADGKLVDTRKMILTK